MLHYFKVGIRNSVGRHNGVLPTGRQSAAFENRQWIPFAVDHKNLIAVSIPVFRPFADTVLAEWRRFWVLVRSSSCEMVGFGMKHLNLFGSLSV